MSHVSTLPVSGAQPASQKRGKSKKPNWRRDTAAPTAVIALELDVSDPWIRRRVENHVEAMFRLKRAVQRDARARVDAYWAAPLERRSSSPKKVRERLGLTRPGLALAAKQHVEDSRWMRDHLTKASALHVAGEVWQAVDRHLFPDATGKRHGRPKVGSWFDFTRCVGRAKSHTKTYPTWETYRLVGSLDGHLDAYAARDWAGDLTPGTRVLNQPHHLTAPRKPDKASWWDHDGPLAVVYTGLPGGDVVLPVRLPSGAGQWDRVQHFLGDPSVWHKVDLVRVQDRRAPGGWRYYAHLMVLKGGYTSAQTVARREAVPTGRVFCVDGNVSNLSVVSRPDAPDISDVLTGIVTVTDQQKTAAQRAAKTTRSRQRALDRSRRASNTDQYHPSPRQQKRAERRAQRGLTPKQESLPRGARHSNKAGVPTRAYRTDTLSNTYRRVRADHAADARSTSRAKHARAATIAQRIVATHGGNGITEHVNMRSWAAMWGRGIQLFSPGMLLAALTQECETVGGQMRRASTRTTALSQTCFCGAKVKKPLQQRTHDCESCGATGDRDLISAALGTCVTFTTPTDPRTAAVDPELATAFGQWLAAQQEALHRSTSTTTPPPSGDGTGRAGSHHQVATAGDVDPDRPTPEQTPPQVTSPDQTNPAATQDQLRFNSFWQRNWNSSSRVPVAGGIRIAKPDHVTSSEAHDLIEYAVHRATTGIAQRARTYVRQGQATHITLMSGGVEGRIQGSASTPYTTRLTRYNTVASRYAAKCTCPYGCSTTAWCKHAVAVAYLAANMIDNDADALAVWLGQSSPTPTQSNDPKRFTADLRARLTQPVTPPDLAELITRAHDIAPLPD